ncbi:hypothetical protein TNCT_36411 [Trichonephila clavata]|uniref:Uncharacterized protein n=1 Tax=Trichonephila clavata TaxID=2740835 RepID=A0A8X6KZW8_TRICU|nr:hypothetical protein TNCT_36411 [Trichonephila clavata]
MESKNPNETHRWKFPNQNKESTPGVSNYSSQITPLSLPIMRRHCEPQQPRIAIRHFVTLLTSPYRSVLPKINRVFCSNKFRRLMVRGAPEDQ